MQDAVIEYKAGGEIDSTNAADREQTLPFDPRDPLSDLRPLTSTLDPHLHPQLAEAPSNPNPKRPPSPPHPPTTAKAFCITSVPITLLHNRSIGDIELFRKGL